MPYARAVPPLLRVEDLHTHFPGHGFRAEPVRAVDGVSFEIAPGEALGLVGESGSGKTTVGRTILRLIPATGGRVVFDPQAGSREDESLPPEVREAPSKTAVEVFGASGADLRRLRRQMQIIFQDPGGSLDPRMRVGSIVAEPLVVHGVADRAELVRRVITLLARVGLGPDTASRYPHEFSGGQRQRIGIARAIALEPRLIVCDEPTSALDVSIQAQIINLLKDLQRDLGLSYLFISHDMGVVAHVCDRIAVMREGKIVEAGERDRVLNAPEHEYTKALLEAVPEPA